MRWIGLTAVVAILVPLAAVAAEIETPNPMVAIFDGRPAKDDPGAKIRIVAAQNGAFTGQAVVHGAPPKDVKASELKAKSGGAIPAAAIQVSYAHPTGGEGGKKGARFDALMAAPRKDGTVHPVWLTVSVPAEAPAGEYEGELAIDGRKVPVGLQVNDWKLPKPIDFETMVGMVQSPDSVALQYGKEPWSDEHWKLMGKTFDQLGRLGNKAVVIPLIAQTNFGNEETMVRWVKGAKEREFTHDFTIAEKYLDLYIERVGKPKAVIFYVYEPGLGGSQGMKAEEWQRGSLHTLLDPATKKVSVIEGPALNNGDPRFPNYPEDMKNFWKPVLEGMHERLAKRGIGDDAFMVGISGDDTPGKNNIANLKAIAPYMRWSKQGHGYAGAMHGMPIGYHTYVWGAKTPPDPAQKRYYGWKKPRLEGLFPRYGGFPWTISPPLGDGAPLGVYRQVCEAALCADARGIGRVGADFWPVLGDKQKHGIIARYPLSRWGQLNMTNAATQILAPGPEGAVATVRFEMLRESVQECEARIFIEKALTDKAMTAKLGDALAKKAQEALDDRVVQLRTAFVDKATAKGWDWFAAESGWQERSARLYAAAGEVAAALGDKK
jgi:hypothetical protein